MINSIIIMILAFTWLGYETDWMRVRLVVGAYAEQPNRKWQFLKYGDDCIMMRDRCYIDHCGLCRRGERFLAWRIPARIVRLGESTINFKEGCNLYRAKLLKDIIKAQKSKALPTYPRDKSKFMLDYYNSLIPKTSIELLVDGKSVANINGNFKRGMIREVIKSK